MRLTRPLSRPQTEPPATFRSLQILRYLLVGRSSNINKDLNDIHTQRVRFPFGKYSKGIPLKISEALEEI